MGEDRTVMVKSVLGFVAASLVVTTFLKPKPAPVILPAISQRVDKTLLRLLQGERDGMIRAPATSAVTFYKGKVDPNVLKQKIIQMIECNPWILARLVHTKETGSEIIASYPTNVHDGNMDIYVSQIFNFVQNVSLSTDLQYNDLANRLLSYMVKKGTECVNKDESQFKITLFEIAKDEEYALMVSLSHVMGDGQTFYQLYSMLDLQTPARPLIVERNHAFMTMLDSALGAELQRWICAPFLVLGVMNTLLYNSMSSSVKGAVYELNTEEITRQKQEYIASLSPVATVRKVITNTTAGTTEQQQQLQQQDQDQLSHQPRYISTNDIITSWYMRACKSAFGMMPMNFRNRFPELTDSHSGNYESVQVYMASDFHSPADIRRSLTTLRTQSQVLPTPLATIDFNCSVVTNWSSFYVDVELSAESRQTLHLPVFGMADMIFRGNCVIFNTSKNKIGVFCCGRDAFNITGGTCTGVSGGGDGRGSILGRRIM